MADAQISGGGQACSLTGLGSDTQYTSVPPAPPAGYTFPVGAFQFKAVGCDHGSSLGVRITFPIALPANAVLFKYGKTASEPVNHWYVYPGSVSGQTVQYVVTDGSSGDTDLATDGTIFDPIVPAVPLSQPPSPIPLSPWLLWGLVGVLSLFGAQRHYWTRRLPDVSPRRD